MASTSGSITTGEVEGRSLTFNWSLKGQSIQNDNTTISWNLKGSGSAGGWVYGRKFKILVYGSQIYYSGSDLQVRQGTTIASGEFTLNHDSVGNKSFSVYIEGAIYTYAVSVSQSGSWTLPQIPRQANITGATDFNDEENPTIWYSNPAGNNVSSLQACISLTGKVDDIKYRDIPKNGGSYTFGLTDEERTLLRNATTTSNSRSVVFFVRTIIGGNTFHSTMSKILKIVNANPIMGTYDYSDTNPITVKITGNSKKIIQNRSNLLFTIKGGSALKGASLSQYKVTLNGISKVVTSFDPTANTFDFGTVNISQNMNATIELKDSRGNITTATKEVLIESYDSPTALISLSRLNNYENETYLKVDSKYSSLNDNNSLDIKYSYNTTGDFTNSSLIVGNDLSGKTLLFDFPDIDANVGEESYFYSIYPWLDSSNTAKFIVCENGYIEYWKSSPNQSVSETIAIYYKGNFLKTIYGQQNWICMFSDSSYTLPGDFGKITEVTSDFPYLANMQLNNEISIEDNTKYTINCDKKYMWYYKITLQDKLSTTIYYATIDKGMPILFIDRKKRSVSVNCFPKKDNSFETENMPVSEAIEISSFDDVGESGELNQSGFYTVSLDDKWYNLFNLRHRNGQKDGVDYGMQIRSSLLGQDLYVRNQKGANNWTSWERIYRESTLYESDSGTTGNITLSDDVDNYKYIEIFYKRGEAFQDSTKVDLSISKKASLISVLYTGNNVYFDMKGVTLTKTNLTVNYNRIFYGNTSFVQQDNNNIKICKIVGYR